MAQSAIVGTFVVGSGVKVGQFDGQLATFPAAASLRLRGREFTLSGEQRLSFPSARLHLAGRGYVVTVPVGPTYPQRPLLRLHGGSFPLGISQTAAFQKPVLRLTPRRLYRVGVPGLFPTTPELIILVPSPVGVGLLVPTTVEVGELLTPSPVRNI